MQTRDSLAATRSTCAITRRIASLFHTISCRPTRRRSWRFSSSRRDSFSAFSTVSISLSADTGFSRKSTGAEARGPHRHVDRRLTRDHHDRHLQPDVAQLRQHGQAVFTRHDDVGEDEIELFLPQERQRASGVVAHDGLVPGESKSARERRQRRRFVVDDEYACHDRCSSM
jgi:hypothetical protein